MPDAAKGVRQLVLLHGCNAAREMVEPEAESLVRIASEVLGDEKGRSGYSYSGLCLTSLPHRKLKDDQAWERTVGPLTLIIEPGRIRALQAAWRSTWCTGAADPNLSPDTSCSYK